MARPRETTAATKRVLAALERRQLLLQSGNEFASVANIVIGEEVRGSWWAHPRSNLIYWVCQDLERHPRVAEARLLGGKVTHLWDTLWPHVAAVALAREPWQFDGLSAAARGLLERVDEGTVDTNVLHWASKTEKLGDTCRMLERRLLVKSVEIHLPSGRHAKQISTWRSWWTLRGAGALPSAAAARERIEAAVGDAVRWLPWHARASGRASK
jgi:hypothetical protein